MPCKRRTPAGPNLRVLTRSKFRVPGWLNTRSWVWQGTISTEDCHALECLYAAPRRADQPVQSSRQWIYVDWSQLKTCGAFVGDSSSNTRHFPNLQNFNGVPNTARQ